MRLSLPGFLGKICMAVAASEVCSKKHCATSATPNAAVEVATIVVIVVGVIDVVFVAS